MTRTVGDAKTSVHDWLQRMARASQIPAFRGTYVLTTNTGHMSASHIWHLYDGATLSERVDVLSGRPLTTYRQDRQMMVVLPEGKVIRTEWQRTRRKFPGLVTVDAGDRAAPFYRVEATAVDRVAGLSADVVELAPLDRWRYGYRIWSEQQTGLIMQTQILDEHHQVLEQAAFSDLDLNPSLDLIKTKIDFDGAGHTSIKTIHSEKIDPAQEHWHMQSTVDGFEPLACYRRHGFKSRQTLQCIFSDGLASVSVFLQPFEAQQASESRASAFGATHAMGLRWPDENGPWWITLVGEVPMQTLPELLKGIQHDAH